MTTDVPVAPHATTGPTATPSAAAHQLRARCAGLVALPGDPAYDTGRMPWNVAVQQRPAAVATPSTAEEVRAVVRAARAVGLRIAPQGTGHGAQALRDLSLDDVVLLRTTALNQVSVDPAARIARVGAGALSEQLVDAAAEHGLAALHGSSPDVGVAGLALGGGIGWYARQHGMTCNAVTAIELVTADGELVRTDAEHDPELFWALRGGGGNFGVVTAIELGLLPISDVYAGQMVWDISNYGTVLRRWNAWSGSAPAEVSTSLRAMRFPPLPQIPEAFRGRALVILDGAVNADDARAEEILADFRALEPELDTWQRVPAAGILRMHMDPEGPTPAVGRGTLVATLDEAGIARFTAAVGAGATTSILMAELRQLGGALAEAPAAAGAMATMGGAYAAYFVAMAPTPELAARGAADIDVAMAALAPSETGRSYLNLVERPVDVSTAFEPDAWARLVAVRERVDPDGVIVGNHQITARR
ncbi:FAD/FMN-containing dehydrogenase [Marmoricola sp. URHA0025 HA25]